MKRLLLLLIIASTLSLGGCGRVSRWVAGWTGDGVHTCIEGVSYIQFTSGASVAYDKTTKQIKLCEE